MSACGQPTEKRQKRAHNSFTTGKKKANNVHDCMLRNPDDFDVSAVRSMENVIRQLAHSIVRNRTQRQGMLPLNQIEIS
jgi:hypothetical protein